MSRLDEKEAFAVEAVAAWLLERDGRPSVLMRGETGGAYRRRAAALLAGEAWAQIEIPIRSATR